MICMHIKKKLLVLGMALTLSAGGLRAQSLDQLIEQLILDRQKLSSLKTILQDLYTSYEVINKGYENIKSIAQGNFSLHKAFFDGLLAVSPTVRNYYRVEAIIHSQLTLVAEYKASYQRWVGSGQFTAGELVYIGGVYTALFRRSISGVDQLTMVLTAETLRMSDAERMQAIDGIYTVITGQLAALRRFNNSTALQMLQRQKETNSINLLKQVYGNFH